MKIYLLYILFLLQFSLDSFAKEYQANNMDQENLMDSVLSPSCFCRYVPERKGDFSWENERIGFRVYSKEVQKKIDSIVSGFDCWFKRVPYLVLDKWYAKNQHGQSYEEFSFRYCHMLC